MSRYRTVFACFLSQRGYDATSPYSPYDLPVTTNPPANPQNLPTQSLPHRGNAVNLTVRTSKASLLRGRWHGEAVTEGVNMLGTSGLLPQPRSARQLPLRGSLGAHFFTKLTALLTEGGAPKGRRELQQNTPATTDLPANPQKPSPPFGAGTESPKALHLGEHHRHSLRSLLSEARLRERRSRTHHFYASHTSPSGVRA